MEKKLTDEEIVQALSVCATDKIAEDRCPECILEEENGCCTVLLLNALDLIHRLQEENTEKKEIIEKQVKIYEKLENSYGELVQEKAEQKAEIERLKDEFKTDYRNSWKNKFFSALEENRELQKQVDEYFKKAYFYYQKCKAYGIENFYDEELEPKPAKEGKTIEFPKFKGEEVE
jgi:hypothetical protein